MITWSDLFAFCLGALLFAADVVVLKRMAQIFFGRRATGLVVALFCSRLFVLGGAVWLAVGYFDLSGVALAFGAALILAAIAWRAWRSGGRLADSNRHFFLFSSDKLR